jgi:hypothetical protein
MVVKFVSILSLFRRIMMLYAYLLMVSGVAFLVSSFCSDFDPMRGITACCCLMVATYISKSN